MAPFPLYAAGRNTHGQLGRPRQPFSSTAMPLELAAVAKYNSLPKVSSASRGQLSTVERAPSNEIPGSATSEDISLGGELEESECPSDITAVQLPHPPIAEKDSEDKEQ